METESREIMSTLARVTGFAATFIAPLLVSTNAVAGEWKAQCPTGNTNCLLHKGAEQSKQGNHQEAIRYFDAAIKVNPNNAWHYHNRFIAKILIGDTSGALNDLLRAIEINPIVVCNTPKITDCYYD